MKTHTLMTYYTMKALHHIVVGAMMALCAVALWTLI